MLRTAASFIDIKLTPDSPIARQIPGELRPDAAEIADVLEIRPLALQLMSAKSGGIANSATSGDASFVPMSRTLLKTKIYCLYKIVGAQQEVRKIAAAIDFDLASSNVALGELDGRRQKINNALTTANFMQGGTLGIIKQSLGLHGQFAASQYELITSFGLGTTLSVINFAVPYFIRRPLDEPPNSLSYYLKLGRTPADAEQSYLWKFFNRQVPGTTWNMTRREVLLRHWHDFAGLDQDSERSHRLLAAFDAEGQGAHENSGLLYQRILLLHDLKTHLEEFDASLYELHKAIEAN